MKDIDTVSVLGTRFNSMVVVCDRIKGTDNATRLKNWYRIDHGLSDNDNAAWGYNGTGPNELAYSILRELFGLAVADRDADALCSNFISILDPNRCFLVCGAQIRIVLGIGRYGKIIRERTDSTEDPEMVGAGIAIAAGAGTVPGGAYEGSPERKPGWSIRDTFHDLIEKVKGLEDENA